MSAPCTHLAASEQHMIIDISSVSPNPIAIGAKPAGALDDVLPRMMIRKKKVATTSITRHAISPYLPGLSASYPFEAKPPTAKPGAACIW